MWLLLSVFCVLSGDVSHLMIFVLSQCLDKHAISVNNLDIRNALNVCPRSEFILLCCLHLELVERFYNLLSWAENVCLGCFHHKYLLIFHRTKSEHSRHNEGRGSFIRCKQGNEKFIHDLFSKNTNIHTFKIACGCILRLNAAHSCSIFRHV